MKRWYGKLKTLEALSTSKRTSRSKTNIESVDGVCTAFQRSPRKTTRKASRELDVPQSTFGKILHKRLQLRAYKVQIV